MARTRPQVGYPAAKKRMTPRRTTSRAGMVAGGKQVDLESLATSTKKPKQDNGAPMALRSAELFQRLPTEVHQIIISFFPEDKDVTAYARICKATYVTVSSSVWHRRFIEFFDPANGTVEELAQKYIVRQSMAKICVWFGSSARRVAEKSPENESRKPVLLKMLKDLIIESDARMEMTPLITRTTYGKSPNAFAEMNHYVTRTIYGKNFKWLCRYFSLDCSTIIMRTNLLFSTLVDGNQNIIQSKEDGAELLIVKLCLAPFALNQYYATVHGFMHIDDSQRMVYTHQDKQPLFFGEYTTINVRWILHAINFFAFHMRAADGEGVFSVDYENLQECFLPQFWNGKLTNGTQTLDHRWIGAYTFLDPIQVLKIRRRESKYDIFMDEINAEEPFSDVRIWFDEKYFGEKQWPKKWEMFLHSNPSRSSRSNGPVTRNMSKSVEIKHFFGRARDSRIAYFYGCVHEIPPQHGIPGFQRITMLKFFPDFNGFLDPAQVWGYEGVVFPGNCIIVGRWWDITVEHIFYSGPFILWNVFDCLADETSEVAALQKEETIAFFNSLNDPLFMD